MSPNVISLGDQVDVSTVSFLRDSILQHQGQDLTLDAQKTSHIGALGVQLLRAAAKEWAQAGRKITIEGLSDEVDAQLNLLGFSSKTVLVWEKTA